MAKIPEKVIETVMETASIIDVVSRYTKIEKRGERYFACCPFHKEKTPSFSVTPGRNMFYCFGCGEGGTVITFLQKIEKISFSDAVMRLAREFNIPFRFDAEETVYDRRKEAYFEVYALTRDFFCNELRSRPKDSPIDRYLKERNLNDSLIDEFKLGYAPADRGKLKRFLNGRGFSDAFLNSDIGLFSKKYEGVSFFSQRLMFPIHDPSGHCIAFGGRIIEGDGPKYINTGTTAYFEKGHGFYSPPGAFREVRVTEEAVICEGYMDVIAYFRAGLKNVFAPLGTAFTENQAGLLKRSGAQTVTVSFDGDGAGKKAALKAVEILRRKQLRVKVAEFSQYKDPDEFIKNEGAEALKNLLKNSVNGLDFLIKNIIVKHGNLNSPEAKAAAASEIFPYIETVGSEVGRDAALRLTAERLNAGEAAVIADFREYVRKRPGVRRSGAPVAEVRPERNLKETQDREFFLFAALIADPPLFEQVRRCIKADDLKSAKAREIYYILEESLRKNSLNPQSVLAKVDDPSVIDCVVEKTANGEFSPENLGRMVSDLIYRERIDILAHKIEAVQRELKESASKDRETVDELIRKKIFFEKELTKLRRSERKTE